MAYSARDTIFSRRRDAVEDHHCIRDSKLYDGHFDTIERGSYIHVDSTSYVGGVASSSSDEVMRGTRQAIAESLVA